MLSRIHQGILKKPLFYIFLFAISFRVILFCIYNAITMYPDSNEYIKLSKYILNFSFKNYTGERTPGYPLLIAIAGGNIYITVFLQLLLALLGISLLFKFIKLNSKNITTAFWTTLIYSFFLHVAFFEFAILTESFTTFLVILCFWFIERYNILKHNIKIKYILLLSVILSMLYLTRPMFIYFPIGISFFYLVKNYTYNLKSVLIKSMLILALPLLSYYSWSTINKNNIGQFTSTYFLGVNLSQMTTPFFEKAPESDKQIRDILVKHRELHPLQQSSRKNPMSVWFAWKELKQETKLSNQDLSNELRRISKNLIKAHPHLYFKQVFVSWTGFWNSSLFFWKTENIKNTFVKKWTYRLWYSFQKHILLIINIIFLVFSLKKITSFLVSKNKKMDTDLLIIAIILSGSLAQALIAYGSNARFCVPFFPLIIFIVLKYLNIKKIFVN